MKAKIIKNIMAIILFICLVSCTDKMSEKDIETVKKTYTDLYGDGNTINDLVAFIAGMNSEVHWNSSKPEGDYGNDIHCVQIEIIRQEGKYKKFVFQYLVNRTTGLVSLSGLKVDDTLVNFEIVGNDFDKRYNWYSIMLELINEKME